MVFRLDIGVCFDCDSIGHLKYVILLSKFVLFFFIYKPHYLF